MPERQFTRATILSALEALGEELTREGVRGQIFIVGGAAMALAWNVTGRDVSRAGIVPAAAKTLVKCGI